MKAIGTLLFGGGFLAGAFFLVQRLEDIDWLPFGICCGVCVLGVIIRRWADRVDTSAQRAAESNMQVLHDSLGRLIESVGDINDRREEIGVYGIHGTLDATLIDDLNTFAQAREAVIHTHGLARYADVMDAFAAGERALNRAWSASADGYIDEVWACLERALRAFERTRHALAGSEA